MRAQATAPIFAIAKDYKNCKHAHVFDKVIRYAILSGNLANIMRQYMFDNNLPLIGEYAYAGLMIQCYRRPPLYYFLDVNVTKTQRMILSYLVHARFEQQSLKNISKYAFKYGKKPGENSIRTHIAKINDFFVTLTTRKIVGCNPGTGYYIFSPANREIETRKKDKF